MGADVAAGLIAFNLVAQRTARVNFIFKDIRGSFLKRAEGDVVFTNNDGPLIQDLVQRALESDERHEATVHVTASVPTKLGDEPVATFELTLSVKKKSLAQRRAIVPDSSPILRCNATCVAKLECLVRQFHG